MAGNKIVDFEKVKSHTHLYIHKITQFFSW